MILYNNVGQPTSSSKKVFCKFRCNFALTELWLSGDLRLKKRGPLECCQCFLSWPSCTFMAILTLL